MTTVNELAAPHSMSLPSISRHLTVLEQGGFVVKGRSAQYRPCRLDAGPLVDADAWMAPYRDFFQTRLPRLERQLAKDPERLDEVPLVRVTFSESDGQTAMTVHFELPAGLSEDEVTEWFSLGVREGMQNTVDRLAAALARTPV